jgi:hypothetical protein
MGYIAISDSLYFAAYKGLDKFRSTLARDGRVMEDGHSFFWDLCGRRMCESAELRSQIPSRIMTRHALKRGWDLTG